MFFFSFFGEQNFLGKKMVKTEKEKNYDKSILVKTVFLVTTVTTGTTANLVGK